MAGSALRRGLIPASIAALGLLLPLAGLAQQPPQPPRPSAERLVNIPFTEWASAGERKEIRWDVEVFPAYLDYHQRLLTTVRIVVPCDPLQKKQVERELVFLVKLGDAAGKWYSGESAEGFKLTEQLAKRTDLEFLGNVYLQPGTYTVAAAVFDRLTGERSFTRRKLRVPPISGDPLAESARGLPTVEFPPDAEGAEAAYLPTLEGKLALSAPTKRRVEVEILANFSSSEPYTGSRFGQRRTHGILLPTLKLLAGLELPNGSLTVTALDMERQSVFFQQQNARGLEWPRLKEGLDAMRPYMVDLKQLQAQGETATFFRDVMERRITAPQRPRPAPGGAAGARSSVADPLRIIIILSPGFLFPRGSKIQEVPVVEDCDCRVFYLRYQMGYSRDTRRRGFTYDWDELPRILKPLQPKRYDVDSPNGMRRALAAMLAEIRRY